MAIKVFMKDIDSATWSDVTSRTVKANFKIREGYGSLGANADLAKLTVTYRASDLATAAVFHTSVKQVKVYDGNTKVFEGYTEGSATVQSSRKSDLAWVKVTAYPYLKLLETAKNENEIVVYDVWASNASNQTKSVLHILWNAMLNSIDTKYKTLIESTYTINIPTIAEFRSIYRLDADSSLYGEFSAILGEFTHSHWLDGFTVRFSKPYADDDRTPKTVEFDEIIENPSIKNSPYKTTKNPVVTIAQVKERSDQTVYKLRENLDEDKGIEDIEIGGSYPDEGVATIAYSIKDSSDTLDFYYAQGIHFSYEAFKHDEGTSSAVLTETTKNIGGTEAEIKLTNNTDYMVDINQITISADRVFVLDKSTVVDAQIDGQNENIETKFINTVDSAKEYMNALVAQQKADTSSITFQSGKLVGIKPNDIVEIGNIPASYIVKYVEKDLITGITKYECQMFELDEVLGKVKTLLGLRGNRGADGKDGESAPKFEFSWSSSPDAIDDDVDVYTWDGNMIFINGISIGKMEMDEWEKLVSTPPEGKPYLWVKIGDGAEFRLTGKKGSTGAKGDTGAKGSDGKDGTNGTDGKDAVVYGIKSVNPQNPIRNENISGTQTITFTADIQNVSGASPIWTINNTQVATGATATYALSYNYANNSFVVGLYDGSVSESNKKAELVVSMTDVTQSPIYNGAISSVSSIPTNQRDGYTHSFLWTGATGTYTIESASVHMTNAFPVIWNGASWVEQTTITTQNANSLFLMISDAQNVNKDTGVFAWFNNLVAKTAAIEKLFSKSIEILAGGDIHSSNFDANGSTGFKIDYTGSSTFIGATIKNGLISSQLDCPSFSSLPSETQQLSVYVTSADKATQANSFYNSAYSFYLKDGTFMTCSSSNASIKYTMYSNDGMRHWFKFYDSNRKEVGYIEKSYTSGWLDGSSFENTSISFTIYKGGDVFKFKSLPNSSSGLSTGQVYRNDSGQLFVVL